MMNRRACIVFAGILIALFGVIYAAHARDDGYFATQGRAK